MSGYVEFDGQRYDIRAQVHTIGGYPAHADQDGLVNIVARMREWPSEVGLVHGGTEAKRVLAQRLQSLYAEKSRPLRVVIPS